jgi:flavin reductase (DIM6/NTAB) family NADH-FMN oxidoreductase RutF
MREDLETLEAAVGRIVSGCSILTAVHHGRSCGACVPFVQRAALEPLMITVCLRHGRPATKLVGASGHFLLNVIGEDHADVLERFGRSDSLDEDAFVGLGVRDTGFGPLIESCIAHIGCEVKDKLVVGDHDLFVGEVVAGGAVDGAVPYTIRHANGLTF